MKPPDLDPHQAELPLSSVASHQLFPGRTMLYVPEVARALGMSEQQVIDLIGENTDTAGASGLLAVDISNSQASRDYAAGNRIARRNWRVPVSSYDAFLARRRSDRAAS